MVECKVPRCVLSGHSPWISACFTDLKPLSLVTMFTTALDNYHAIVHHVGILTLQKIVSCQTLVCMIISEELAQKLLGYLLQSSCHILRSPLWQLAYPLTPADYYALPLFAGKLQWNMGSWCQQHHQVAEEG